MRKFLFRVIPVFALFFFIGLSLRADAGVGHNLRRWLVGGGVATNPFGYAGSGLWAANDITVQPVCDADSNSAVDVSCGGSNDPVTSPWREYGMTIPASDGPLSGYAWSEYYGWLSFDGADTVGCPSSTGPLGAASCQARREGNAVKGWARILSIRDAGANSGGWSGYLSLNSANCDSNNNGFVDSGGCGGADNATTPVYTYGLTDISKLAGDTSTCTTGSEAGCALAWSDELGYIDLSHAEFAKYLKICTYNGGANCSGTTVADGSTVQFPNVTTTKQYQACYGVSPSCAGAADTNVTGDAATTWNETNTPNVVKWSAASPAQQLSVDGTPNANDVEQVGATYSGQTVNFNAMYSCNPLPANCQPNGGENPATVCRGTQLQGTDSVCGTSCQVAGTKTCDTFWEEVAP